MNKEPTHYSYYSFPSTPKRSPAPSRTSRASSVAPSPEAMAPTPSAGKATGSAPKTPTKLGWKPQSSQTPKLGQASQSASSAASGAKKTAQGATQKGSEAAGDAIDKAAGSAKDAKGKAESAADDAKDTAEDTAEEGTDKLELKDNEAEDDDEGPLSKVTEAKDDAADKAGDVADKAKETTEEATEDVEDAADDATEKAGDVGESTAGEEDEDADEDADASGGVLSGAKGLAGKAQGLAGKAAKDPKGAAGDVKESAEEGVEDLQDTAEGATGDAEKVAGDAGDAAEDAAGDAEDAAGDAEDATGDATDKAEGAADDAEEGAEGVADEAKEGAEGAADEAEEGAEGAADEAEEGAEGAKGAKGGDLPDLSNIPLDLSVLEGLEVNEDGIVEGPDGPVGKLVEGDAEDLAGYPVNADGEILDDDGDLVGRVELLPDTIKKQLLELKEKGELPEEAEGLIDQMDDVDADIDADAPQLPGLEILKGLTCDASGNIVNEEGDTIGQVTDGNPEELMNATLNEHGEFINEDGEVIGHAEVHPDAAGLYDQAEGVEDQLPGVEALEGRELNEAGEIVDADGNVLGQLEGDEAAELREKIEAGELNVEDLKINDEGQVVDAEGNVVGTVGLAEGAAEKLKETGVPTLDIRILAGKKISKKGKILDEDGEIIGEVSEGEIEKLAGKKPNEKGEVLGPDGEVIGKVSVVPGEAAENATRELLAELGELPEDAEGAEEGAEETGPQFKIANLETLEGLKVNKKGKVLDEEGNVLAELVEGELSECAGKKLNAKGEVLNDDGDIIGRVKALPQELTEEELESGDIAGQLVDADGNPIDTDDIADAAKEGAEEALEEADEDNLPPLSILEGLKCNKYGKIVDGEGRVVGELVEGDAKKLAKSGAVADNEGQFWDNKGKVIGRAKTLPQEDADDEPPFAGLEGLKVVEGGFVEDENGNRVGTVVEGDAKKLIGRDVDEDGDILDRKGTVVGHAERYEEEELEEAEPEAIDYSILEGKKINKSGLVLDDGVPIGRLVEGNAKELAGRKVAEEGKVYNDSGKVVGQVEVIPESEREAKAEGVFAGLEDLHVVADGKVADAEGNIVGEVTEGNPKKLIGHKVDEDGDILDSHGDVKGHAEPLPDEEEEEALDNSILDGKVLNKQGFVVNDEGIPIGKLVEGNVKELAGRRCDEDGLIHGDTGKVVGRCEVLPENERVSKPEGIFAGLEGLHVTKEGFVEDEAGNRVGVLTEGNAKKLAGLSVDEDGDVLDKYGNSKGHAEQYEEEEEEAEDLSPLEGCTVNKAGNVVDSSGTIVGRVAEGDVKNMIGKKVDGKGQIWSNDGKVIGRAELVHGQDSGQEGPFAGFDDAVVQKDGTVVTPAGDIIGRITEGDVKKLVNHHIDESGDILDKNGNVIGKAERWEPEEKERKVSPMSGRKVNREGEVRSEDGDVIGRLTAGDLGHCVGQEIDDNGNVVDQDGNKIGEATLLENIVEDEEEEGPSEEELTREKENEIAEKMTNICSQTLDKVQPICKQITEHIEKADRTPREELDEEDLVDKVKPLIEEGGRILQECNGSLRGLDPDGKIAAQAKGRAGSKEASPEEVRLADTLKELTSTVVTTIDNAKKRISDMPHAKKKLSPLWGLMTQPLFQILAAVGLLLAGVLGLVGQILSGLGLGGLVNGILGPLGITGLMGKLGLPGLGGDDKKKSKKGGMSSIPVVGGLLGGK